jgi:long-subunit acyl-CoA synthetase (AMP-forming)
MVDAPLPADHRFVRDLAAGPANHVPLTPIDFLARSAAVWPDRVAVRHGRLAYSYATFDSRVRALASALAARGVRRGDTVAVMAPNVPAMLELHYAVPALGAVLNALNVRLDAAALAFCLAHALAEIDGPDVALRAVDAIQTEHPHLARYHLFHAVRADLLRRLGRVSEAAAAFEVAIGCSTNRAETDFLRRNLHSSAGDLPSTDA